MRFHVCKLSCIIGDSFVLLPGCEGCGDFQFDQHGKSEVCMHVSNEY